MDKLWVNNNVGDVTLLKLDAIESKLSVKLVHHRVSHIWFKIEYFAQPNSLNEITNIFFDFSGKKFIKSSCTKFVNEIFALLLVIWKSECKMNIDINIGIIFGRTSLNRCVIVYDIFSNHTSNSPIAAITPLSTSLHNTGWFTPIFFKDNKVCWNVKLEITAAASIWSLDHSNNGLIISTTTVVHLLCSISTWIGSNLNNSWSLGSSLILIHHF